MRRLILCFNPAKISTNEITWQRREEKGVIKSLNELKESVLFPAHTRGKMRALRCLEADDGMRLILMELWAL